MTKVESVTLEIGEVSGIVPEYLADCVCNSAALRAKRTRDKIGGDLDGGPGVLAADMTRTDASPTVRRKPVRRGGAGFPHS